MLYDLSTAKGRRNLFITVCVLAPFVLWKLV